MIKPAEAAAGLYGAMLLLRRDPAGLAWFDSSARGFVNSFWAAALVFPAFFALELAEGTFTGPAGVVRPLLIHLIGYVVFWTAFPLLMAPIADSLGKGGTYIRFVIAYNWSGAIQMAIYFPVALLMALFPGPGTAMANLFVTAFLLAYQGYIAYRALDVGPGTAAGVVILDLLLGVLINAAMTRMIMGE